MTKKYKFIHLKDNFYRIAALRDIPRHNVKASDWGGLVSGEHNLSQKGDCWIGHNARVYNNALVGDYVLVCDNAVICDDATAWGNVHICDNALICDNAIVVGGGLAPTKVGGTAVINGTTRLEGGIWSTTPKVIRGPVYDVIYNTEQIAIGCECHPLEWWEEHGLEVAEKDGLIPIMIDEYRRHLDAIKKEYANRKEV